MADTTIREKIARAESERQRIVDNIENTYITIAADYSDVLPAEENSDNLSATVSSALSSAYQEGYDVGYEEGGGGGAPGDDRYDEGYEDGYHSRDNDIATLEGYIDDTYREVKDAGYTVPDPTTPEDLASTVNSALSEAYTTGGSAAQQTISNLQSQLNTMTSQRVNLLVNTLAASIGENLPPYRSSLSQLQTFLDGKSFLNNAQTVDTGDYDGTITALAIITFTGVGTVLRPLMLYTEDGTTYSLRDTDCSVAICQGEYFNLSAQIRAGLANLRVTKIVDSTIQLRTVIPPLMGLTLNTDGDFELLSELNGLSIGELTQEHAISGTFISNPAGNDMEFSGTIALCKLRNTE